MSRPHQARLAICLLSVVLLVLQCALYAHRQNQLALSPAHLPDREGSGTGDDGPLTSGGQRGAWNPAAQLNFSRNLSYGALLGKECGGQSTGFPRNRILIIHEQHLQSMGCDVRLLRFIKDLLYLNQEVSMLFRGMTPAKMRQPKSKQLASILHINNFEEDQLRRKTLRPPPGLYEWTNAERFAQLMALGYFNVVIIFLWFWYDPQPSVAELVLPLVRAHSPADKQPFVALLCDDAHAIR